MHLTSIYGQTIFQKTEIKEDDDLRSYVNQGLLDGIRKSDPKRGSSLSTRPHMDEENIFLGEASYRFIRDRLIKSILRLACQRTCSSRAL
jgi:hypothetical protein